MPASEVYVPSPMELLSNSKLQAVDEAAVAAFSDYASFLQVEEPDKPVDDVLKLVSWACAISMQRRTFASIFENDTKHRTLLEAAVRHVAVGDFHDLAVFRLLHHAVGLSTMEASSQVLL
jgi:hypothetical protein